MEYTRFLQATSVYTMRHAKFLILLDIDTLKGREYTLALFLLFQDNNTPYIFLLFSFILLDSNPILFAAKSYPLDFRYTKLLPSTLLSLRFFILRSQSNGFLCFGFQTQPFFHLSHYFFFSSGHDSHLSSLNFAQFGSITLVLPVPISFHSFPSLLLVCSSHFAQLFPNLLSVFRFFSLLAILNLAQILSFLPVFTFPATESHSAAHLRGASSFFCSAFKCFVLDVFWITAVQFGSSVKVLLSS